MKQKEGLQRKKTTLDAAGRVVSGKIALAGSRGLTYKDIRELTRNMDLYPNLLPSVLSYLVLNHFVSFKEGQYTIRSDR